MKVTKQETLYHEDHGATLKHKCGRRIVTLSLLSFSLIFFIWAFYFLMASFLFLFGLLRPPFFRPESHPDLWGNHSLHHPFLTWDNALIMMIITLLLIKTYELQLEARTRYASIWMPPAVYRDGAMNQEWHVWKIMHGGFATNTMSTTWSCNGNMTKVKYVMMMINGTVESCMAIYLGMDMEMP